MRTIINSGFIFFAFLSSSYGQTKSEPKTIYNKDFNWTISIPAGFDTVSSDKWKKMQNQGADLIEKTYDEPVENNAKTIFVFQSDQLNYFESNYQPFDTAKYGNYFESFKEVNNMVFGTFKAQIKDAKIDSSYSTQVVSGLTFLEFKIVIDIPNKFIMKLQMFSRLFGSREFSVNILTVDKEKEKELLNSWLNSKFQ